MIDFMTPILAFSFINGAFLPLLGLVSIPIIIYLFNRQRYQRVPWAAMDFLLRAMQKNRKRLRLENWLLLLVRTLIVLFLVLGMLRPLLDSGELSPILSSGRNEIIVLDRSFSMAYKEASKSNFYEARDRIKRRLRKMSSRDRVCLYWAGGTPVFPLQQEALQITETNRDKLFKEIEDVQLVYESLDLGQSLSDVNQFISEFRASYGVEAWQVVMFTDMQRSDWLTKERGARKEVSKELSKLEENGAYLLLETVGSPETRNVSVSSLSSADQLLTVDLPVVYQAEVVNRSADPVNALELELWIDGEIQGGGIKRVSLDAGESKKFSFQHTYREPGLTRVRVVLREDGLEVDNQLQKIFQVRESVEVIVFEGRSRSAEEDREVGPLIAVLGMNEGQDTGLRVLPYNLRVMDWSEIMKAPIDQAQIVILSNVPNLGARENQRIEDFVARGGGLLVFLGDLVQAQKYNEICYREGTPEAGKGWLKYPIGELVGKRFGGENFGIRIQDRDHPSLANLAKEAAIWVEKTIVMRYRDLGNGANPESLSLDNSKPDQAAANTLLALNTSKGQPLLTEASHGRGSLMVFHMGPSSKDSNIVHSPVLFYFLFESLPYLLSGSDVQRNLAIGGSYSRKVKAEEYAFDVQLVQPNGNGGRQRLQEDGENFLLQIQPQYTPGIYEVRMGSKQGQSVNGSASSSDWFALNVDPEEGVLSRVSQNELLVDAYPQAKIKFPETATIGDEERDQLQVSSSELWRDLIWSALILLFVESLLARFFARKRV